MKKKPWRVKYGITVCLTMLIIFAFTLPAAHAEWVSTTPPKVSIDWGIEDLFLLSSTTGWAVGQTVEVDTGVTNRRGLILRMLNGTWVALPATEMPIFVSPYNWELTAVHFPSPDLGWAVGNDIQNRKGIALRYSNGSWTSFTLPDVGSLNWELHDVFFISPTLGWAVGQDITNNRGILLTFFNGVWVLNSNIPEVSSNWGLSGVQFTSETLGWVVGTDFRNKKGIVLQFLDDAWFARSLPVVSSDWELYAVHFLPLSAKGWAVGRDSSNKKGVILQYSGGEWTSVDPLPVVSADWGLLDVYFRDSDNGWAAGQDSANKRGVILQFSGGSWTSSSPLAEVSSDWDLSGIQSRASDDGWAVGRDYVGKKGVLLRYAVPSISVSTNKLDFKNVTVGLFRDLDVTVRNSGRGSLTIGTITSPSEPFAKKSDSCSDTTLSQGSCKVTYRFSPSADMVFNSSSNIPSNDPQKELLTVTLKGTGVTGVIPTIDLQSPLSGTEATPCSYATPFTFQWIPSETFKATEIQFSLLTDFSTVPVKVKGKKGVNELTLSASTWKKILLLPGPGGGPVYWMVVGTTDNNEKVESNIFSISVKGAGPVLNPEISPTSQVELPTLSWENNCNTKFKAWFANDPDFTKAGVKKKSLSFSVKNPEENGGIFTITLTESQWKSIRKLVGDAAGSTIYWYVDSTDPLKRTSKTDVFNFVLTEN